MEFIQEVLLTLSSNTLNLPDYFVFSEDPRIQTIINNLPECSKRVYEKYYSNISSKYDLSAALLFLYENLLTSGSIKKRYKNFIFQQKDSETIINCILNEQRHIQTYLEILVFNISLNKVKVYETFTVFPRSGLKVYSDLLIEGSIYLIYNFQIRIKQIQDELVEVEIINKSEVVSYTLYKENINTIGRDDENRIIVKDRHVSRYHAEIIKNEKL